MGRGGAGRGGDARSCCLAAGRGKEEARRVAGELCGVGEYLVCM